MRKEIVSAGSLAKIDKPGIYALSMADYHAGPCAAPSVGSSGLRTIINECPLRYWWDSELNPAREAKTSEAFEFGKAAHDYILEPDAFLARTHVLSTGCNLRTNAGKAERDAALAAGKTVIDAEQFERIAAMRDALLKHDLAGAAFSNGRAEPSIIWRDGDTGVWLRARPDYLPDDYLYVPDYKTAASARPSKFIRAVYDYGYHMQAAHIMDGVAAVTGNKPDAFYFIVQEKEPPYIVSVITLDNDAIEWGRIQNRAAVELFARCLKDNRWPAYAEEVVESALPAYAQAELQRRHGLGAFAIQQGKTP